MSLASRSALSSRSLQDLADSLQEDFSVFLNTNPLYEHRLAEVLADAVTDFLDVELGEVDEQLALDLGCELVCGIRIG